MNETSALIYADTLPTLLGICRDCGAVYLVIEEGVGCGCTFL